jgi:hypothetical protein
LRVYLFGAFAAINGLLSIILARVLARYRVSVGKAFLDKNIVQPETR